PDRPAEDILEQVQAEMDQVLLGYTPADVMRVRRIWAAVILGVVLLVGGFFVVRGVRSAAKQLDTFEDRLPQGSARRKAIAFVSVCLAPAVVSLLVWAYYPLLRGLVIAFQDYRIVKGARWVGLDNF